MYAYTFTGLYSIATEGRYFGTIKTPTLVRVLKCKLTHFSATVLLILSCEASEMYPLFPVRFAETGLHLCPFNHCL